MKITKKILSMLLVLLMCVTAVPFSGFDLGTVASATETVSCANKADFDLTQGYIYFGSYPQLEVTDSATISALNAEAPDWENWTSYGYYSGTGDYGTMTQGNWMRYTDVTYNGEKYRGVKFTEYRPTWTGKLCHVNQNESGYSTNIIYWFKFESLKWRVLDASTGLIMCETIIDSQPYSNTIYKNSNASSPYQYFNDNSYTNYASDYKTSSIRAWLNDDFYNTAFTSAGQSTIATTTLSNKGYYTLIGNNNYTALDSNDTNDKVFLLSYDEAVNNSYFSSSTTRQAQGSDYAICQGLDVSTDSSYLGNSSWLLRSPGYNSNGCCGVRFDGFTGPGYGVFYTTYGVRPALTLNLDSLHTWTHTDAKAATSCVTPDGNVEYWYCEDCDKYIVENEDGEKVVTTEDKLATTIPTVVKDGEYILLGSYPQSKVTDEATISALNTKAPDWKNWTSYGYYTGTGSTGTMTQGDWMRYTDVTYNGEKYRGVKFTQYRPYYTYGSSLSTYQDDNGYYTDTVYWFKFESLKWRVLDDSTGLIMCETIIDSQPYSNTIYSNGGSSTYDYFNDASYTHYASDYETSSIRAWLNDDFYNTAFTSADQSTIATTTLNNDGYYTLTGTTGYEELDSNDTNDKIFLLSYDEMLNTNYGFSSSYSTYDTARQAHGSDYAKCQGLWVSTYSSYLGNSDLLLRSPGYYSDLCCRVTYDGYVSYDYLVYGTDIGVRPALKLNLDTLHTWTHTDAKDATCTEGGNVEYWYCTDCGKYIVENEDGEKVVTDNVGVSAKGHSYVGGACESCGEPQAKECTCMCHKNTIAAFVYMILDVILTLCGSDFDCRCGESHF